MRPLVGLVSITILISTLVTSLEAGCYSRDRPEGLRGRSRSLKGEVRNMFLLKEKYRKACNVESFATDDQGLMSITFEPEGCEKTGRLLYNAQLSRRAYPVLQGRGFIQDALYCLINIVQNIATAQFKVPGLCCSLGFPFSIFFSPLCGGGQAPSGP